MEATSLDNILDEKPAEAVANEPPAEVPVVEESSRKAFQEKEAAARAEGEGKVRDASGKFVAKTEEPKAEEKPAEVKAEVKPEAPQMTEKERALLVAAQDERRKRQDLEKEIATLRAAQAPAKPQEPVKTFWDDPEGVLNDRLTKQQTELSRREVGLTLKVSEMLARNKYQDFDTALTEFGKLAQQTPGLAEQMLAAPDPAEFAYATGKRHKELQDVGGLDAWKANETKRIRMELEAELKTKAEQLQKDRAALPPSLSNARGTVANKAVWGGPTPLDAILK